MIISNFVVSKESKTSATRVDGKALRSQLLCILRDAHHVTIDFSGVTLTPSFADEFLGGTMGELGKDNFKSAISIVNLPESAKPLVRHILNQHAKMSHTADWCHA